MSLSSPSSRSHRRHPSCSSLDVPAEPPPLAHARPERTMTIGSLFSRLSGELDRLGPTYVKLRVGFPVFGLYPSLPELLDAFTGEGGLARKLIVCGLIDAQRRSPHRLWVALLLRAFRPMLRKLWKNLFGAGREERLALLVASFHEAVASVDPYRDPVRIGMYVRQATRKGVFAALGEELDWEAVGFGADADEQPDPTPALSPVLGVPLCPDPELVGTLLERGALWSLVRRTCPFLSQEDQARVYTRLRDRRRNLVARLREQLRRKAKAPRARATAREVML